MNRDSNEFGGFPSVFKTYSVQEDVGSSSTIE